LWVRASVRKTIRQAAVQLFPFCILQRRRKFGKAGAGANLQPRRRQFAFGILAGGGQRGARTMRSRRISNAFWRAYTHGGSDGKRASERARWKINLSAENWERERCELVSARDVCEGPNFAQLALAAKRQVESEQAGNIIAAPQQVNALLSISPILPHALLIS
jgi:hypothetical protein